MGVVATLVTAILALGVAIWAAIPKDEDPDLRAMVSMPAVASQCAADWIIPGEVADGAEISPMEPPENGVLGTGSQFSALVQEASGHTVVLHSMRARVTERTEPVTGTHLQYEECGTIVPVHHMLIDFDAGNGDLIPVVPDPEVKGEVEPAFPWTVAEDDPLGYGLRLKVGDGLVRFVLELEWSWGGEHQWLTIDNHGDPFVVSSFQNTVDFCHLSGWNWTSAREGEPC